MHDNSASPNGTSHNGISNGAADPVLQYDIVVIGGGSAGSAAAIAAARHGHKVLLVEEGNCLGGVSTAGGVNEWFASLDGLGDIFDRVRHELSAFGANFQRFFNGEYLKLVWQLEIEKAGVQVLFHASLSGVHTEGGRILGGTILSCSRPIEFQTKYLIDCSGEGDAAALAGAEFMKGHKESGRTLNMSLTALLHDTGRPVEPYLPASLEPIHSRAELPNGQGGFQFEDGRVYCNSSRVQGHDPTDPFSLSLAELEARKQLFRVVHYLQQNDYPTHMVCSTGGRIGIREGRRIVGDYIITQEDILEREERNWDDGVCVATCQTDFHSLTRQGSFGWRQRVEPYAIPFRCLYAKGFANLLMAGKCISGDQVAQSSYRMTPTCCAMGQATGTAAALAVEQNLSDIRGLDITQLRARLVEEGVELDPTKHEAFCPELTPDPAQAE